MGAIVLENLSKSYGKVEAVRNLNLTVEPGEFLVLLGPSGCGKTTTLRMIAGLETPTSGEIYFGGRRVTDVPPDKRNVAMVFQNLALYPHMTVFDNVAFCLRNQKRPRPEIEERVMKALETLGIAHLAQRLPAQVSGGERQRVALARAMVRNPSVFLLDEPLSQLDAKIRVVARSELKLLHMRLQGTFVYVTHDQIEAMSLGTKVAVMNLGVLVQVAPPEMLYTKPADEFTATFIGSPSMNLILGEIGASPQGLVFATDEFCLLLPERLAQEFAFVPGHKVKLGIRPEDLTWEEAGSQVTIPGVVQSVEPLGRNNQVNLRVGSANWAMLAEPAFYPQAGDVLHLVPNMDRLHFFAADSGRSIRRISS